MIDMTELHKEQKVDEVQPHPRPKSLNTETEHAALMLS